MAPFAPTLPARFGPALLCLGFAVSAMAAGPSDEIETSSALTVTTTNESERAERVQLLIKELGAASYRSRRSASVELIELGDVVLPIINAHLTDPDPEVRQRCQKIHREIVDRVRSSQIERFEACALLDADGKIPGWTRLKRIVGDTVESRRWMALMVKMDWELVARFTQNDHEADEVNTELRRLADLRKRHRVQPSAEALATIMLASAHLTENSLSQVLSLMHQLSPRTDGVDPWSDPAFRKLVGHMIQHCTQPTVAYQSFTLALRHGLREGLTPALAVVADERAAPHIRQYAILTIARFGNEQHVESLEPLFDDEAVCYSRRNRKPAGPAGKVEDLEVTQAEFICQLRDVALASVLHLLSQDPRHFGYGNVQRNTYSVFQSHSLGFSSEEQRAAAHSKWFDFRNQANVNRVAEAVAE